MKRAIIWASLAALVVGCSGQAPSEEDSQDALTSLTARSRDLEFEGVVYVPRGAADSTILKLARKQSQSAFGALLNVEVAVESREVRDIDPASFKKREIKVVDTDAASGPGTGSGTAMLEVRYTYRDSAVVPVKLARRTSLPLALLGPSYDEHETTKRVVTECTKNDHEAREDAEAGLLWYNFNPSKASCAKAITTEQKKIESDRQKLTDKRVEVPASQANRVYVPVTMSLGSRETARGATYPEYDKLFSGGVEPGKLVIGLITGRMNHDRVAAVADGGYYEWMDALGVLFKAHPGFKQTKIDPAVDVSAITIGGKRLTGLGFADFIEWTVYDRGYPEGLTAAEKKELRTKIADKLDNHWVTFQLPVKVTVGGGRAKDFVVELNTLFGADEDAAPHKRAVKKSDVFIYNGHSYIGYGPLDPSNFRASDFPSSYQLFFIDGCVSYNYYNEGYFLLKPGGTKNLDTITNGLEAPEYDSGAAEGRLVARLIDGSSASYRTLLTAAKSTDPMRVVDGETDNEYVPSATPIRVEAR